MLAHTFELPPLKGIAVFVEVLLERKQFTRRTVSHKAGLSSLSMLAEVFWTELSLETPVGIDQIALSFALYEQTADLLKQTLVFVDVSLHFDLGALREVLVAPSEQIVLGKEFVGCFSH